MNDLNEFVNFLHQIRNGQYSHNVCSTCVHIIEISNIDNGQESGHLDGQSVVLEYAL